MDPHSTAHGRRCILFFSLLSPLIVPRDARAETLNAVLSFTEVVNRISSTTHFYGQPRMLDLSVIDRSRVFDWNARRPGQPNERARDLKGSIGTPIQIGATFILWRFGGPKTIVRETSFPSFLETITIAFHRGGCDASVAYRLKPGTTSVGIDNIETGASLPITNLTAENVHCSLGASAVS